MFANRIFESKHAISSYRQAADLVVPTGNVYFGNLFSKHIFVTHHLIDHASTNDWYGKASLMRKYYGHVLGVQVKSKHTIYTDFEHDRHELTIGFPLQWQVAGKRSFGTFKYSARFYFFVFVFFQLKAVKSMRREKRFTLYEMSKRSPSLSLITMQSAASFAM